MRFSRSTHLLMFLSLETLTSIIRTGLHILVELLDLVNSVIIFSNDLTQMVKFPTRIPDWLSQSCFFGFIYFFRRWYSPLGNSDVVSASIDFPSYSQRDTHFIAFLMTILVLIGTFFMIIWENFPGRISLKLVSAIFWKLKIHKFKNLDEIAITTNVYLYKHCQKTKTLCRHLSRFPTFTAWD